MYWRKKYSRVPSNMKIQQISVVKHQPLIFYVQRTRIVRPFNINSSWWTSKQNIERRNETKIFSDVIIHFSYAFSFHLLFYNVLHHFKLKFHNVDFWFAFKGMKCKIAWNFIQFLYFVSISSINMSQWINWSFFSLFYVISLGVLIIFRYTCFMFLCFSYTICSKHCNNLFGFSLESNAFRYL